MKFNESLIPDAPAAAGENIGEWGYGVAVYGAASGHARAKGTPSLMADMYGFTSEEEMSDTKAYLCSHGDYQLEQVGVKRLVALLYFSVLALVALVVARGGEATSHLLLFKFLFKSIFLVTWGGVTLVLLSSIVFSGGWCR